MDVIIIIENVPSMLQVLYCQGMPSTNQQKDQKMHILIPRQESNVVILNVWQY